MIVNNSNITSSEFDQLKEAIADITILIAGADGKINSKEIEWAEKITDIRSYSLPDNLKAFYAEVGKDFHDRLENHIATLPHEVDKRSEILEEKLRALNPILAKLDHNEAAELYSSYVSFAKHVAKSAGGFMGFFSVSYEESRFVGLPMIEKIIYEEEDEA